MTKKEPIDVSCPKIKKSSHRVDVKYFEIESYIFNISNKVGLIIFDI